MSKKSTVKLSGYGNKKAFTAIVKPFLKLDPTIFTIDISTTWTPDLTPALPTRSA